MLLLSGLGMTRLGYLIDASQALDPARLLILAVLAALLCLIALLTIDPSPTWWVLLYLALTGLVGVIAGLLLPVGLFNLNSLMAAGAGLLAIALLGGRILHPAARWPIARSLWKCSWIYLSGWIAIGLVPPLERFTSVWALSGLIIYLALATAMAAKYRSNGKPPDPRSMALNLYLLSLNIILALVVLTGPTT